MSAAYVIDASVGFSWMHSSQATAATDAVLEEAESGAEIVVPALWFAEIANTLLVMQRRKKLTPAERRDALKILSDFTYTVDEEGIRNAFGETCELAARFNLSIYDSVYLELAQRRKLTLCSRDAALLAAASKIGVKTK